ncbi:MAG TPA: hypothetical protein VGN60_12815 [Devosia sp.]|jgi:hypothetical protein|nr:hypothetical protein [Devosia sp.]
MHFTRITAAAVALAFAFPAVAQDTTSTDTDTSAETAAETGAAMETESDAEILTDDFRSYPALISRVRAHASINYPAGTEQMPVVIVNLSELSDDTGTGMDDLRAELSNQVAVMDEIRSVVKENESIRTELEAQEIAVENVVALSRETDGTLVVYVNDTGEALNGEAAQ